MSDKNKDHLEQENRVDYHHKENQYNKKHEVSEEEIKKMKERENTK